MTVSKSPAPVETETKKEVQKEEEGVFLPQRNNMEKTTEAVYDAQH